MIGIYKITSPSGRVYIGKSKNIQKRWKIYKRLCKSVQKQRKLYESFKKYGVSAHIFEVVEECPFEILSKRERFWQDFYDVTGKKGLNCHLVNTDEKSREWSEESKDKMRGENNPFYGKTHSEEHLKYLKSRVGELSPAFGLKRSKETIQKCIDNRPSKKLEKHHKATKIVSLYLNIEYEIMLNLLIDRKIIDENYKGREPVHGNI